MYNRYVPQPDGSYQRNRMQDKRPPEPPKPQSFVPPAPPPCEDQSEKPVHRPSRPKRQPEGGFLQRLLPKDFDIGDLIVILLLLLMAGDCEEDRNNALLTIALYFMM